MLVAIGRIAFALEGSSC